jgi:tetratricopeptide (TPR) repeat protein
MVEKSNSIRKWIVFVAALVTVIIAGVIVFSNSPSQKLKKQLNLGQKYLNDFSYEQAVTAFKTALEIQPNSEEAKQGLVGAYSKWGDALVSTEEFEKAISVINEAISVLPDNQILREQLVNTYLSWAYYFAQTGDYESAIKILQDGYEATGAQKLKNRIADYEAEIAKANAAKLKEQFAIELKEWMARADFPYTIDNVVLGQTTLAEVKAAYSGRSDYKSNPMTLNGSSEKHDTVYSMPYMDGNSWHDSNSFGYFFAEALDSDVVFDMGVCDPTFICLGGLRAEEPIQSLWDFLGIQPPDGITDITVENDAGDKVEINDSIFRIFKGNKMFWVYSRDGRIDHIGLKMGQ